MSNLQNLTFLLYPQVAWTRYYRSAAMVAENAIALTLAAGTAATITELIVHPADTVLTHIQAGKAFQRATLSLSSPATYTGLYHGFGPTIIASIPASIAFFAVYESSQAAFKRHQDAGRLPGFPHSFNCAISSAIAEAFSCAIINPAQVIKQNAQVRRRATEDWLSSTRHVVRQFRHRPQRLWTGYTVLLTTQLPAVSLTFWIYESLKSIPFPRSQVHSNSSLSQFQVSSICGLVAGCCSSWMFVPFDIVRLRMRLIAGLRQENLPASSVKCGRGRNTLARPKFFAVAKDIICHEGYSALLRGSFISCASTGIATGLYLGCYECFRSGYTTYSLSSVSSSGNALEAASGRDV